jgi:hypothetical protein
VKYINNILVIPITVTGTGNLENEIFCDGLFMEEENNRRITTKNHTKEI